MADFGLYLHCLSFRLNRNENKKKHYNAKYADLDKDHLMCYTV